MDAPDVVDQLRAVQEGVGDKFGPQGIAGHEDGLGEIARLGGIVRSGHRRKFLSLLIVSVLFSVGD